MDGAALADLHGRRPRPGVVDHVAVVDAAVDTGAWAGVNGCASAVPAFELASHHKVGQRGQVQRVVDLGVGQIAGDGDGAPHEVAHAALEAGGLSAAVVSNPHQSSPPPRPEPEKMIES